MPTYRFGCPTCGQFHLVLPMSQSGATASCPGCASDARRIYEAPALRSVDAGLRRALDSAAQSADAPVVVNSVPGRSRAALPTSTDPRHAQLPRA